MILESILAYLHLIAIFAWIVFAVSQAAVCHLEWMNEAALKRLVRLDTILWTATASVALAGIARVFFGVKGVQFYALNWLLYTKIALFLVVASLQIVPSGHYRRWLRAFPTDGLPAEDDVRNARRNIMIATHLMAIIPLPAVFLARGFGYFG